MRVKLALAVVVLLAVTAAGVALLLGMRPKPAAPAGPKPAVISLYIEGPAAPGEPGIHVADVHSFPDGRLVLAAASDPKTADRLDAALTAIRAKAALPLLDDAPGEGDGHELSGDDVAPNDARYPYAVAAFVRQKTGLKYRVRPPAPAKP